MESREDRQMVEDYNRKIEERERQNLERRKAKAAEFDGGIEFDRGIEFDGGIEFDRGIKFDRGTFYLKDADGNLIPHRTE